MLRISPKNMYDIVNLSEEEDILENLIYEKLNWISRMFLNAKISYSNQFISISNEERLEGILGNLEKGLYKIYASKETELLMFHYVKHDEKPERVKDLDMILPK